MLFFFNVKADDTVVMRLLLCCVMRGWGGEAEVKTEIACASAVFAYLL